MGLELTPWLFELQYPLYGHESKISTQIHTVEINQGSKLVQFVSSHKYSLKCKTKIKVDVLVAYPSPGKEGQLKGILQIKNQNKKENYANFIPKLTRLKLYFNHILFSRYV